MRKKLLLVSFLFNILIAYSQDVINYFQVGEGIATPVIVHTNKGKFTIYGGERIDGNLYSVTAYDAQGKQIVENTPQKTEFATGKPTIRYYYFKSTYKSSNNETSNYENNNKSYGDYNTNESGSWGTQLGQKLNDATNKASRVYMEGYPNLQVRAGWSLQFGEIVSLKTQLGGMGGSVLAGGVGKNLFNPEQNNLAWFAEVGWYGGDGENDITFNVLCGRNLGEEFLLAALLEYSYFFDLGRDVSRFGVFASGQYGLYWGRSMHSMMDFITCAAWDFRVGITYKIFSN